MRITHKETYPRFKVGDYVLFPSDESWRRWSSDMAPPEPTVLGVVTKVLGPNHVVIDEQPTSWHIDWLAPCDEFDQWVWETRRAAGLG